MTHYTAWPLYSVEHSGRCLPMVKILSYDVPTRRGQSQSRGFSSMRVNPDTAATDTPRAKAQGLADSPAPDAQALDPPT